MTGPTVLSPWYVVQRFRPCKLDEPTIECCGPCIEYYTTEDEERQLTGEPKRATLFMQFTSAVRVANSLGAEIRVLTSKEDAAEFGR